MRRYIEFFYNNEGVSNEGNGSWVQAMEDGNGSCLKKQICRPITNGCWWCRKLTVGLKTAGQGQGGGKHWGLLTNYSMEEKSPKLEVINGCKNIWGKSTRACIVLAFACISLWLLLRTTRWNLVLNQNGCSYILRWENMLGWHSGASQTHDFYKVQLLLCELGFWFFFYQ